MNEYTTIKRFRSALDLAEPIVWPKRTDLTSEEARIIDALPLWDPARQKAIDALPPELRKKVTC